MKNKFDLPQLFLRLALGVGFLLPVMDRLGWLGEAGVNGNAWGNWPNFVAYTNSLMPFMGSRGASVVAVLATLAEIVFGIALLIGCKTKLAAMGSSLLTLAFAISMFIFSSPRAPFNYSVFVCSASSFLLATIPLYKWSVDEMLASKK